MSTPRLPRATELYQPASDGVSPDRYGSHEVSRVRAAERAAPWRPADLAALLGAEDPETRLVAAVLLAERSLGAPARRAAAIEALTPLVGSSEAVGLPDGSSGRLGWAGVSLRLGREVRGLVGRLAVGVVLGPPAWRALVEAWLVSEDLPLHIAHGFHRQEPDIAFAMLRSRSFAGGALPAVRRTRALRALLATERGGPAEPLGGPSASGGPRHVLRGERLGTVRVELLAAVQSAQTPEDLRFDWAVEWAAHDHARFRRFREVVQAGTIEQARRYLVPYVRVERTTSEATRAFGESPSLVMPARWLAEALALAREDRNLREVFHAFNALLGGFHGLRASPSSETIAAVRAALLERPDAWARLVNEAASPHLPNLGLATLSVALRSRDLTRCLEDTVRLRRTHGGVPIEAGDLDDLDYALRWLRQGVPPL